MSGLSLEVTDTVLPCSGSCAMDSKKLKKEIIRRTGQFHSRRYTHKRITFAKHVVIVERSTLPRTATEDNIRRQAVEGVAR